MDRTGRVQRAEGSAAPHAHVLGLDGRGMSGLAHSLVQQGMTVTGSGTIAGASVDDWRRVGAGVGPAAGRRAVTARTRLLVHGPEVAREHAARLAALRRGIRQETPAGWLGDRMRDRVGVTVSGGREAGRAAAMLGFVLAHAGLDPSVVLAAPARQLGGWSRVGAGPHLVAQWDGAPEGFEVVRPALAVLLNVGADPWVDRDRWTEALRRAVRSPGPSGAGFILALGHPALVSGEPIAAGRGRLEWVSLQRGADWWGTDLREESGRFRFRVFHRGRFVTEVGLQTVGRRGVAAALTTVAACGRLGVPTAAVREGLAEFAGLARDFESRGSFRGVSLVDDEADDPASIRDALGLARRVFGGRRLWAVHAAPGSGDLRRDVAAFSDADRVLAIDRGAERGSAARTFVHALSAAGIQAGRAANLVEAVSELDRHLEPGDVLLTLGAGDVGTIADAFIRRLPRDRQGG